MEKLQVSVVMPAYNCAKTIAQAIDSVLIQEVPLELIVVNDCSPEDLDGVMAQYKDDSRVVYVKNETNLGAAASRNKAVSLAKGQYVAFLDSDDYWLPGKLKKQLQAIKDSGAVLCCTARELMTPEGELTGRIISVSQKITYRDLLLQNSIGCSSVLMLADVAKAYPMQHEDSHEDYIMWLEVLKKHGFACGINEPLLKYRLSTTGKSGNKLKAAKMTFKVYRYMGFGMLKSCLCFISYALHGVMKYALSYLRK